MDIDPMEAWERSAEKYADENMDGDQIRCCNCKKMFNIDEVVPSSKNPFSPPLCRECAGW